MPGPDLYGSNLHHVYNRTQSHQQFVDSASQILALNNFVSKSNVICPTQIHRFIYKLNISGLTWNFISTLDINSQVHDLTAWDNNQSLIADMENISVVVSNHSNYSNYSRVHKRLKTRTLVDVPIVNDNCSGVRRHLRLCCLNARSIKNKSADFVCYALSIGADVFVLLKHG